MPLQKDKLLATKEDFTDFRDISANVKSTRLEGYVRESQIVEIRDFVGQSLYTAIQNDYDETLKTFTDPRFDDLWFGTEYTTTTGETWRFNGLLSALIYWSYGRFLVQQQVNVSRFGVESVQNDISEDIDVAQVRIKQRDAQQVALRYQNDAEKFLNTNAAVYPEYVKNNTDPRRSAFTFFKV